MAMSDDEKFVFDLNGYLVRPAILTRDEIDAIADQVRRAKHDPESLPAAERRAPGGAASLLVDHPRVVDVLTELLPGNRQHDRGNYLRCDTAFFVWRERGEGFFGGELHRGADSPADPFFGYRVHNGQIHAGQVNVVFELTDVGEEDGGTGFIVGSHKSNFPLPESHTGHAARGRDPDVRVCGAPLAPPATHPGRGGGEPHARAAGVLPGAVGRRHLAGSPAHEHGRDVPRLAAGLI